jgi:hypothetical protein
MSERTSTGRGRICGIYTLGVNDPYAHAYADVRPLPDAPFITASIGEDFADCQWPLTVKAQRTVTREQLSWYLTKLYQAVDEGFFMDPAIGPAIYWRWSGSVIPGMSPDDDDGLDTEEAADPAQAIESAAARTRRSNPGGGPLCGIYLVDDADKWLGDHFYGKVHADTAISGSIGEDFAASRWPVVVKIRAGTRRQRFCEYLRGLIACLDQGLYFEVPDAMKQN